MKTGMQGFIGYRLREAREARCLTQTSLAEIVGVSRAMISLYEKGPSSPSAEVAHKLSQALNVPIRFFLIPVNEEENKSLLAYRSFAATTAVARTGCDRKYEWIKKIFNYCSEFVEFPAVNMPDYNLGNDINKISNEDIERAAIETRNFFRLKNGPISNMVYLLEHNGVRITRFDLNSDALEAFSHWDRKTNRSIPYIVLNSSKDCFVRSRFDAAHELGHLIVHRDINFDIARKTTEFKLLEEQAFLFASAFLLPAESFAEQCWSITLDTLIGLKAQWLVSVAAMLMRVHQLDLIDDYNYKRLWLTYSKRGYKRSEPLDESLVPEQPVLLGKAINMIVDNQLCTKSEILYDLALSSRDVEDIASLPSGYFDDVPTIPKLRLV